jgi:Flp pilus assembly protein TadG
MTRILASKGSRRRNSRPATTLGRLRRHRRDERGFTLVFVGVGFLAMFAATMLAIDVGMLMTARTQAQTAADAGALAGATALVFNSYTNRSSSGPAVRSAINTARANLVIWVVPSVTPDDVTFPTNPVTGQSDLVQVTVHRTAARGNPVSTMIARFFGIDSADIMATATATAAPADTATCVLPFTIPDKWIERQCGTATCTWSPDDTFNMYEDQGNRQNVGAPLSNPDIYIPPGSSDATGYSPVTDRGTRLVLKSNTENRIAPGMYNAWAPPGSEGADDYRENIEGCNPNRVRLGSLLTPEPGNMTGPTRQGTDDLMAQDPDAHWDTGCNCVRGSRFGTSPRIRAVPLYNPVRYAQGQHTGRSQPEFEVVNYLGFFVEEVNGGGEVIGRIMPITGTLSSGATVPIGGFAQAIILVR